MRTLLWIHKDFDYRPTVDYRLDHQIPYKASARAGSKEDDGHFLNKNALKTATLLHCSR
jgi:hypothetical protein